MTAHAVRAVGLDQTGGVEPQSAWPWTASAVGSLSGEGGGPTGVVQGPGTLSHAPTGPTGHGGRRRCRPSPHRGALAASAGAVVAAGLSLSDVQHLPAVVDLVTAGRALGLGRTKSYQLARTGGFPCRVIRVGKTYLVPTAELLALLGLDLHGGHQHDGTDHGGPTAGRCEEE